MKLDNKKRIHFVGIGGIGMSAVAYVLLEMGYKVSGSDRESNDLTKNIESIGGKVFAGHRASNISKDVGVLVYSSAISRDNPELRKAIRKKIQIVHRAEMLGELFNKKKGIAVTGTHGKTTTTSLISVMLAKLNLNPTVVIGGEVSHFKGNAGFGDGPYMVAEADESDSSFLHLKPFYAVITNTEMEHLDHYKTLSDVNKSYRSFIDNLREDGIVFYNYDDPNARKILENFRKKNVSFGFSKGANIYPIDITMNGFNTSFKCAYKGKVLGTVKLNIPGRHNVLNALAAVLVGLKIGLKFKDIANSIKDFDGAKRRFQLMSDSDGVMLIDDYAHHPTEIKAVLDACTNWKDKRIIAIFQPHRYTRTKFLAEDFGRCFKGVDKLILTDIYAASEKPIRGVSIKNIYDKVKLSGIDDVAIIKKEAISEYIMHLKRRGDMILVLGAGDIKEVANDLFKRLSKKYSISEDLMDEFKKLVKGKVKIGEALAGHASFKIGGPTDIWVEPDDAEELKKVLIFAKARKIPIFVIGNGSNILVSDSGFRGISIYLGASSFRRIKIKDSIVNVGAGFSLSRLVRICCGKGLAGLESLVGIPGTVGGAVYMNAGGSTNPIYKNIGELVMSLKVMDYRGRIKNLKKKDIVFNYRSSNLAPYIILEAALKLAESNTEALTSSLSQFMKIKREKQPSFDAPSAGCIFKNPPNSQFTCGQMIDMLGLKGRRVGGAEISEKHANFIINKNDATSKDVLALIKLIKKRVKENYDIPLELEIKII